MKHQLRLLRPPPAVASGVFRAAPSTPRLLPPEERSFFESRLGQDFSQVRVHTGEGAAAAAAALGARAFVMGDDIVFADGRYDHTSEKGRRLLAHELVHVAQQRRGGSVSSAAEPQARAAAERVTRGEAVTVQAQGGAPAGVYCDEDDEKKKRDEAGATPPPPVVTPTAAGDPASPSSFNRPSLAAPGAFSLPPLDVGLPRLAPSFFSKPSDPLMLPPATFAQIPPILPPFHLMENADILAPLALHGTTPAAAGFDMMGDWAKAYTMFRHYLPPSLPIVGDPAAWSANHFLAGAYDANLAFNQPNIFDKSALDMKAAYPDEWHTPILPILTPTTLPYLLKAFEYGGLGLQYGGKAVGGAFQFVGDQISALIRGGKKKK